MFEKPRRRRGAGPLGGAGKKTTPSSIPFRFKGPKDLPPIPKTPSTRTPPSTQTPQAKTPSFLGTLAQGAAKALPGIAKSAVGSLATGLATGLTDMFKDARATKEAALVHERTAAAAREERAHKAALEQAAKEYDRRAALEDREYARKEAAEREAKEEARLAALHNAARPSGQDSGLIQQRAAEFAGRMKARYPAAFDLNPGMQDRVETQALGIYHSGNTLQDPGAQFAKLQALEAELATTAHRNDPTGAKSPAFQSVVPTKAPPASSRPGGGSGGRMRVRGLGSPSRGSRRSPAGGKTFGGGICEVRRP
jgi:hypothetical protein